jgi:hypothetical protein
VALDVIWHCQEERIVEVKAQSTQVTFALAAAFGAMVALPPQALVMIGADAPFTGTPSVSDADAGRIIVPAIAHGGLCTGKESVSCTSTISLAATTTNASLAVSAASLDSYVSSGTVLGGATFTASMLSAQKNNSGTFPTTEFAKYSGKWVDNLSTSCHYLLRAKSVFDGASRLVLDLDFGILLQGDAKSSLGFNIFNLAGPDQVSWDLDSISGNGNTGTMTTNLAMFLGLLARSSNGSINAALPRRRSRSQCRRRARTCACRSHASD